jgi:sulfatase maturation enzyme AslB (radical SAM superfamily)
MLETYVRQVIESQSSSHVTIAWQGGDLERYLPLYPFLFLAVALKTIAAHCQA